MGDGRQDRAQEGKKPGRTRGEAEESKEKAKRKPRDSQETNKRHPRDSQETTKRHPRESQAKANEQPRENQEPPKAQPPENQRSIALTARRGGNGRAFPARSSDHRQPGTKTFAQRFASTNDRHVTGPNIGTAVASSTAVNRFLSRRGRLPTSRR